MDKIDITMPATLRPSILEQTLKSFTTNIFTDRDRYRLIFNVDPVGEKGCKLENVVDIAKEFFDDVVYNTPGEPSFPKAWKWCWDQVTADFVFHLEEDWELLRLINIDHMIKILNKNKNLATLRMLKMDVPANLKFFRSQYTKKDGFLQAGDRGVSFGGNPQLTKGVFVKESRKYLLDTYNPEKQFRRTSRELWEKVVRHWDYGVYAEPGDRALVKDIGREWMRKHRFQKGGGLSFTKWEKIK